MTQAPSGPPVQTKVQIYIILVKRTLIERKEKDIIEMCIPIWDFLLDVLCFGSVRFQGS